MELIARHVSKLLQGKRVLTDVDLHLLSGHVYGFVGNNGAGKTMLFRALSGLMRIDAGEIWLDRMQLHQDMDVLPNLGIMLEHAGLYPEYTGRENLEMLAAIKKVANRDDVNNAISRVGLDPEDKRVFRKYSLGMKQRIVIAQAIMERPDIIMLDEPTSALDETGIRLIRSIIREEQERGAMVLIASHNKEDIRCLADVVYCVSEGGCVKVVENSNHEK